MSFCLFCEIIKGSMPCYKVWEDKAVMAFLDIYPVTQGHVLIVPKRHSDSFLELDQDLWSLLGGVAQKVAQAYLSLGAQGNNLFVTQGAEAGQTVFHTHWHCIPRHPHDRVVMGKAGEKATVQQLEHWQGLLKQALQIHK